MQLEELEPFVGEWSVEASLLPGQLGRAVFEWALGGAFLVQRADIPHPDAPDVLAVISGDPATGGYAQHYFDSRGVVRLYAMRFEHGTWTLRREAPDFSALDFAQRFTGTFADDGGAIHGRWEMARDGGPWELDFELTYTRVR
jgi:hypothetical protein